MRAAKLAMEIETGDKVIHLSVESIIWNLDKLRSVCVLCRIDMVSKTLAQKRKCECPSDTTVWSPFSPCLFPLSPLLTVCPRPSPPVYPPPSPPHCLSSSLPSCLSSSLPSSLCPPPLFTVCLPPSPPHCMSFSLLLLTVCSPSSLPLVIIVFSPLNRTCIQ